MIAINTYTVEWITALRGKLGKRVDPKLLEKASPAAAVITLPNSRTLYIEMLLFAVRDLQTANKSIYLQNETA